MCNRKLRSIVNGPIARIVATLAGRDYTFHYRGADRPDAERWVDDARHQIAVGRAPRDVELPDGCPLRPQ